ncbi:MAG TPA: ABC transporter substrate binding protein [Pyrinomonadaceae bacterium]|nr:ABC transporter substrate binding protein [Pyrinomonadaceae bacterium]
MSNLTQNSPGSSRNRHPSLCLVGALVLLLLPAGLAAQQNNVPKRVLVLHWDSKDVPANVSFDKGFQAGMQSEPSGSWESYGEYLDSARFPGEHQNELLHDYLRDKYADTRIDVVVADPEPSLEFLLKYRNDLFSTCPIVFIGISRPPITTLAAGPGLTGIIRANTQRRTLDLALQLHPDTKQVFVISGTPEHDKRFELSSRHELAGYEDRVAITYLTDLSLNELVSRTQSLPKQSVILYVWQRATRGDGKQLMTYEVLELIAKTANAPIYGMGSRNVGNGLVGGYVQDSERNGLEVSEIVRRIFHGTRAQDIPVDSATSTLMFDWRQLQHWGISESKLPNGAVIRFKELSFWQLYKWRIVGISALLFLQTLIIAALLFERNRRRLARQELAQLNTELEARIVARTAALDAKTHELETFAYSVAHDLKAPLRGIHGYSRLLLEDHAEQLNEEGQFFLATINTSTEEMNQLIEDLLDYSRLERRDLSRERIELQPLVQTLVRQKERQAGGRQVDFVVTVNGGTVMADAKGLSQALNNYLDNALKFTREVSPARVEIGSEETTRGWVLWVRDNGIGFDMKYHDRIFQIFQRLHRPEDYPGTGVGLAIVRKAMERMGGRAWAQSQPGQGATFYLEIPG